MINKHHSPTYPARHPSGRFHTGRAWSIASLLAILSLVNFLDKVVLGLVAVPMMTELSFTPAQFGVLAGSIYWLFAVAGVAGGFLANRYNTRWLLLGMALIWSVVQLPIAWSASMTTILVARVLLGIGEGPATPVSNLACYKWFPNDRRNLPVTVINFGATLGLLLAGILIPMVTTHWGWRANFVALALLGAGWTVLWLAFGAEGPLRDAPAQDPSGVTQDVHRVPYLRLLADPTVVGINLLHFAAYWGMALALTWLPTYLQNGLGFDGVSAGRCFALIVLVGVPIGFALSWGSQRLLTSGVSSRVSRAVLACVALLVAGLLYGLPLAVELAPTMKLLVLAIALGLGPIIFTVGPAMLCEVVPPAQRGSMLAIENSFASIAGILAPVAMGRLIGTAANHGPAGYEQGFAWTGALLCASAIAGLMLVHPERSRRRLPAAPSQAKARADFAPEGASQ